MERDAQLLAGRRGRRAWQGHRPSGLCVREALRGRQPAAARRVANRARDATAQRVHAAVHDAAAPPRSAQFAAEREPPHVAARIRHLGQSPSQRFHRSERGRRPEQISLSLSLCLCLSVSFFFSLSLSSPPPSRPAGHVELGRLYESISRTPLGRVPLRVDCAARLLLRRVCTLGLLAALCCCGALVRLSVPVGVVGALVGTLSDVAKALHAAQDALDSMTSGYDGNVIFLFLIFLAVLTASALASRAVVHGFFSFVIDI